MTKREKNIAAYDDEAELATYIWDHYSRFFTQIELLAARTTIKPQSLSDEAEVRAWWARGPEVFRRRAASRVLLDHPDDVFINRCERCGRIVRTPKAQQCLWCGYDWHPSPET